MGRMVQQKRVIVTDDLDGTEGAKPYRFAWQNTVYEIDLNDEHRDELLRALQPFIDAGRRAGRRTVPAASGDDRAAIRPRPRAPAPELPARGRISAAAGAAYTTRCRRAARAERRGPTRRGAAACGASTLPGALGRRRRRRAGFPAWAG